MDNLRFHRWALYVFFYYHAFSFKAFASCYFPNGTDVNAVLPTEVYQPCNAGDQDSMCCALNRPYPDKCRSDGLCFSTFDSNIWRDSCTDRSWKSPKCIKLCDSGIGQYIKGVDIQLADFEATITPCGDGSYCCGNGTDAQSCCDKKKGVFLSNGETTSKNPSGTSSLASESSTSTSKTSISTTLSHDTSSSLGSPVIASLASSPTTSPPLSRASASNTQTPTSSKNKAGAIVGGVIGGIAILALLIGMTLILARQYLHAGSEPKGARSSLAELWSSWTVGRPVPHEVSGTDARKELDARQMQELDAGRNFHELHDTGRGFHEMQ